MATTGDVDPVLSHAQRRVGSVLRGKYRLDRVLGVGGMAAVYKATHRNEAEFAVKILHAELNLREDLCARFLREGKAANSVRHPGVVRVVDDDVAEDGAAFLVMELLDGAPVDALWRRDRHRVSPRVAVALADQLLDVLAAAHAKGVIHRDIKPANLFVVRDGTLKVLDFGIARIRDAAPDLATRTGTVMGTAAFMAPEQAFGIANEIDGQSDVWSVGATLYALLSGQLVHQGDNAAQSLVLAATRRAAPVRDVVSDLPRDLAEVIDRGLSFERANRWPTAVAMRRALQDASIASLGEPPSRAALQAWAGDGGASDLSRTSRLGEVVPTLPAGPSEASELHRGPGVTTGRAASWQTSKRAVSASRKAVRPPTSARMILAAIALLAMLGAGTLIAVERPRRGIEASATREARPSAVPGEPVPALVETPSTAQTTLGETKDLPDADASPSASGTVDGGTPHPALLPPANVRAPADPGGRSTVRLATPVAPRAPQSSASSIDCAAPTFLDEKGHVHLKPGCQ